MTAARPRVLLLGGLEPTGRAGLLADVATARALGADPIGVATALTAQGTKTFASTPVAPLLIRRQLQAAQELGPIDAVKLGMVPDRATLKAIQTALKGVKVPWVIDPVVRTSRGQPLSTLQPKDYLALAGPNVVLTPNQPEAAWLLGAKTADEASLRYLAAGFQALVLKGGHRLDAPMDVLYLPTGETQIVKGTRLPRRPEQRGTGCRHATALAVALARGEDLLMAARLAKRTVTQYLRQSPVEA